ncbi:hypothetical protein GV828_00035 [Flavobacterium sp. NST-5]|uniref:Uncharacterized protein n=1 Tax=Flavobacterium ichthyis TaxID=2698827 RepID=A0ABW9Z929_9FLAO|nr:hypothetical protein [Flavobacterium ichthyis]NBL63585.1 hypothetical protein [Flavobacterium ichthyis]
MKIENSGLIEEMIFFALLDTDNDDREKVDEPLEDWGDIDPNGGDAPTAPGSAV